MSAVAMADDLQSQRHQDIQQILKSMKDLAAIFNDLALLVVEQVRTSCPWQPYKNRIGNTPYLSEKKIKNK